MKALRTVAELRTALAPARRTGLTIGLVPTMGALHEGHLTLIRRARAQCDEVVVSLFVNPAQFNEPSDLERYPRREHDDAALAAGVGADLLFAPPVDEVYPQDFATAVEVLGLTDRLEGAARGASHFRGVTTVVTKLLGMATPDVLYLGQKDAQQALVIRRLVTDLNMPVRIEVCPTVRAPDGLALSSRNALLDGPARAQALALPAALHAAQELAADGERSAARLLAAARAALEDLDVQPDYLELVDPDTLEPLSELDRPIGRTGTQPAGPGPDGPGRPALLALAAHVGGVRLIDNVTLQAAAPTTAPRRAGSRPGAALDNVTLQAAAQAAGNQPRNPQITEKGHVRTRCSA